MPSLLAAIRPRTAAALVLPTALALGQEQEAAPRLQGHDATHEEADGGSLWTRHHLTGDWGGLRSWLRARGVAAELFATIDASRVVAGGLDRAFALRTLVDATLTLDSEPLLGYPGGTLFADFQFQRGDDGSLDTGDLQRYSNIDHDHEFEELAMLWYEQALAGDTLFVKVGKNDVNADFQAIAAIEPYLHPSFGHSPNILAMPTYPDTAFGAQVFWRPGAFYAGAGVYDGALQAGVRTGEHGPRTLFGEPAALFAIAEAGIEAGETHPRLAVGAWRDTGTFARFAGGEVDGTAGWYALAERAFAVADGGGELAAFAMYGWADPDVSEIEHHIGAGVAWHGFLPSRPDDAVGLGASYARFSRAPGAGFAAAGELALEAFWLVQVAPWLALEPALTWIDEPGGQAGVGDAWVLTLRTAVVF
ncbi:MAG: carbohydrate porin [Planctomycetota bacterium]